MVNKYTNKDILKVWLKAPINIRVERIMKRENSTSYEQEKLKTMSREESEKKRYNKYYSIDIDDLSIYDIIIDTKSISQLKIVNILLDIIKYS